MNKLKLCLLLLAMSVVTPGMAGSLYLTGHDILDHDGQNGYWRVIIDYLRGKGTASEIAEADYHIAVLCSVECDGVDKDMMYPSELGWTGPETKYNPATIDNAGWNDVFTKDLIVVVESIKITDAGRTAFNGKKAQLESYFNAGGDLWMNTNNGDDDYYTVLPASVLSTGSSISTDTGFSATPEGVAIGLVNNMMNGHQSHNIFTSIAPKLVVFELFQGTDIMSVGIRDAILDDLVEESTPIPALSPWALVLLLLSISGLALKTLRPIRFPKQ